MPANWIAFARRDLHAAEVLLREGMHEEACFHCQQAAEKALKGFLLHHGQTPPRSHDLPDLLQRGLVFDAGLNVFQAECAALNEYYIPTRYPDIALLAPAPAPDEAETQEALDYARAIVNAIELLIFPPPASPPLPSGP